MADFNCFLIARGYVPDEPLGCKSLALLRMPAAAACLCIARTNASLVYGRDHSPISLFGFDLINPSIDPQKCSSI